jgi:hypothetical protein
MKSDQKKSNATHGQILDSILINQTHIFLNFETQILNLGRPFRLSGTRKNLQLPEKWIDKVLKNHWIYSFIYLDERGGFFEIEIDYSNNFLILNEL